MSTTTVFLLVAALLLTGLSATPAAAHPFGRFRIPAGRYRWRAWQRRYSPPAATPTTPTPSPPAQQCTCAPSAPTTGTGAGGGGRSVTAADVPEPDDCITPLAGVSPCLGFLTGRSGSADAPAPGSECCAGLAVFFDSAAAAGGGGDSQLKCLCPVIRGDINALMVGGIDPLKMIFLPSACAVAVPPQVVPLCLNASSHFVTASPP